MRFQIKKILEGFDPADLIEQSMYCFGSSDSSESDESVEAQERSDDQATGAYGGSNTNVGNPSDSQGFSSPQAEADYNAQQTAIGNAIASGQSIADVSRGGGLSAFGGVGGASSTQSTAGSQSTAGDMAGGSMSSYDPTTGLTQTYSPTQVPSLEMMKSVPYDIFNIVDKVNKNLLDRDARGLYSQVTRDEKGNVTGSFNNAPAFGLGFMPNVTTYTGFDQNPYNEDMSYMDGNDNNPTTVAPTRNPVSGQPVCPDGYRYDDDLQACRLDTSSQNRSMNNNQFPSGDAYYRATSLDQAPVNAPSGFDFNSANQNFVNNFAYRPANFTNQMGLSGFTPFRRS